MEDFWYNNPNVLLDRKMFHIFFPTSNMNLISKLNSMTRLSLYISLLLFLYNGSINYFYIFIVTLIITFLIYKGQIDIQQIDSFKNLKKKIIKPTNDNPFMNIALDDYLKNPKRCSQKITSSVKKDIQKKFNNNLYKDINDVFSRKNSQRQFYTVPVTTIPNNQEEFSKWLYDIGPTCKEGNGIKCDINNHRPLYNFSSTGDLK